MIRIVEVIDVRTGDGRKTGHGAELRGHARCAAQLRHLKRMNKPGSAFLFDWKDEDGNILESFEIDETGFEKFVGKPPESAETYTKYDQDFWRSALTRRAS